MVVEVVVVVVIVVEGGSVGSGVSLGWVNGIFLHNVFSCDGFLGRLKKSSDYRHQLNTTTTKPNQTKRSR